MGDKVLSLGTSLATTAILARYLGPENYGIYSYVISASAIFASAGHMGLSGLVVRELVRKPREGGSILGTTLILKFIGMLIGYTLLLIYSAIYEGFGSIEFQMIAIAGAVLLIKPFDIVEFWFQAFVQAKYASIARVAGLIAGAMLKIAFAIFGFGLVYFAFAYFFEGAIVGMVLILTYVLKSAIPISSWRWSRFKAVELFGQGWLVYLGSIFAVINLKIDQVMLRWMEGADSVGIYGVAAQLSEAWYFLPVAIVSTFFPKLIQLKDENSNDFNKRLQQLFDLLFAIAFCVAVIVTMLSGTLVQMIFGSHYAESSSVLVIHIWAAIFVFMRAAFSKWILIENALLFSLLTQGLGALINIVLNYLLIPRFGVEGAAYATLISYASSSFLSLALYSKTRPIFFMMLKSFFSIIRYPLNIYSK
jgi:O-antigen/teichoic acid export membrane protein